MELSEQNSVDSILSSGIVNSYDLMSDDQKIDYVLSKIEQGNFLKLEKDELFMLSIMSAEIIKKIVENKNQEMYDRNKLIRLAQAVKLIKYYLIETESKEMIDGIWNGGSTRVTKYYTSYEGDFANWAGFYNSVKMQGSGVGSNKDRVYRYYNIQETKDTSEYKACSGISCNGITASGNPPITKRTLAVPPEIPLGTEIYVDFGADYKEWNGCYVGEDRGGAITGNHIDFYSGVGRSEYDRVNIPENANIYLGCS
jgi:3D (Asp-Asp-Asp) domain-containing protein